MSAAVGASAVLSLYRQLLRAVHVYPSSRRGALRESIRDEFRAHRHVADAERRLSLLTQARAGLKELRRYQQLDKNAASWSISHE